MIYNINDKLQMKHDKSIKFTITGVYEGIYSTSLGHDYFDYELDMYCEKATNEEMGKMKEMSLKGKFYGTFGEATDMTYEDWSPVHTGDIVELYKDGSIIGHRIVAHSENNYGVMGVFSRKFTNGKADDWRIKLVCKYYNNNKDKVGDIIIVDKDQFIQLEGGKLNITEAKRLGLWKEDKKVFTVDKDCEIEYGAYKIQSYERAVYIFVDGRTAVRLYNPTVDKVRHEFAYYGIDVEVK